MPAQPQLHSQPWQPQPSRPIDEGELANRFTYHPPQPDQLPRFVAIREQAHQLARLIVDTSPASREQSLAITHLEDAVMWANAAIARNE